MSKHYRLSKQQLIDLERYEIRLADDKIFFNDSTETFFHPYKSEDAAKAEFEKICEILTEKRNEPLFYAADGGAIVNLREVKAIAMSNVIGDVDYIYFEFGEEWSYRKSFPADDRDLAANELRRLKELLAK